MTYTIKEIFYTLQGEGIRVGRPAVFCRFAGCNLWSGAEQDRQKAVCKFCDTDFIGTDGVNGGKFQDARSLSARINELWPIGKRFKYVVLTGGEPLLQVDSELLEELHRYDFEVAVETNGTIRVPPEIDWLTVSPKSLDTWVQREGDELKLIFPQQDISPEDTRDGEFTHYLIQPMDGQNLFKNTEAAIKYCQQHPLWRLSLQTHKMINIR